MLRTRSTCRMRHATERSPYPLRPGMGGLSLIELLVAAAIAAALLSLAVPALVDYVSATRARAALDQLLGGLQTTRNLAATMRVHATYCATNDGLVCARWNEWHLGAMVFADADADGERDAAEAVLLRLPAIDGRVTWRSFRRKHYLQFTPTGLTSWQNGSFLYCPPSGDVRFARMVILNAQGRVRSAPDTDGDGIVETASGRPVACDD